MHNKITGYTHTYIHTGSGYLDTGGSLYSVSSILFEFFMMRLHSYIISVIKEKVICAHYKNEDLKVKLKRK